MFMPRLVDFTLAATATVALLPLLLLRATLAWWDSDRVFDREPRMGRSGRYFQQLSFAGAFPGRGLAVLLNLLRGELALTGPRARPPEEAIREPVESIHRQGSRPGLFSPYALRRRVGIAHEAEVKVDRDHVYSESWKGNLGLVLRFAVGRVLGGRRERPRPPALDFFDIPIVNTDMHEAVDWIATRSEDKEKSLLCFVNPDCLNIAYKDESYKKLLQGAARVLPDGIGIHIGCRVLGVSLAANVNGSDLFPPLCERAVRDGLSLFLLGARPGVAQAAADNMCDRFPGLEIAGTHHGYFTDEEGDGVIQKINESGADILLVAMGAPRQEKWLDHHHEVLEPAVRMGVGGQFDFYSGRIPRAPMWMREIGLEWVWRLLQEPGRMWRRYVIGNPLFLYRVWRQARREDKTKTHFRALSDAAARFGGNPFRLPWLHFRTGLKRLAWLSVVRGAQAIKRVFDVVVSSLLLIILAPFFLVIATVIRLESPGPIFFKQTRIGRSGKPFTFWKIRSMYVDAEARKADLLRKNEMAGGVLFKMKQDPRITRVGRIIRRASIDELPQLWNVLKGDMSLVGPRPPLAMEVNEYSLLDRRRLEATPGITCIWQISGRSDIPFPEQVKLDVEYIHSQSFWADLRILFKTIPAVLTGRGAY